MTNSKYGQGHMDKYLDTGRNTLSKEMLVWNIKALGLGIQKDISKVKSFQKVGKTMSRSKGKKHCFPRKGLVTNTHCSKIIQQNYCFQNIGQIPRSKAQG